MPAIIAIYREKIDQYEKESSRLSALLWRLALGRFASFAAAAILIYYGLKQNLPAYEVAGAFAFIVFILMVRRALSVNDQKRVAEKLLFLNRYELDALEFRKSDKGSVFSLDEIDQATDDLDLLGKESVYRLLSRCTTLHGKQELRRRLENPDTGIEVLIELQEAIKKLAPEVDTRQQIAAVGLLYGEKEGSMAEVLEWVKEPPVLLNRTWIRVVRFVLPVINLYLLINYLVSDQLFPLLAGLAVSWMIVGLFARHTNRQHLAVGKKQDILQQYAGILVRFNRLKVSGSVLLGRLQERSTLADESVRRLSRLVAYFDQRLNMLVNVFLNSLFLYDIHCLWALEIWREKNRADFAQWIHAVGEIEVLCSLAGFAHNHPSYAYPIWLPDGPLHLEGRGLRHPLIPPAECVPNDFSLGRQERLMLITGSNMSGKTTFLRTLGVNMVLGLNGVPVAAQSFTSTPLLVLSSIRVSDSLQEHTSYFMAELKLLHQIIDRLSTGRPCLVLMDEILRGTNSDDKTHGSAAFIRRLLQFNCLTLFATHDLVLSSLAEELPGQVGNSCFESEITGNDLHFDYRLRPGVARNRNASFLMKKMDII